MTAAFVLGVFSATGIGQDELLPGKAVEIQIEDEAELYFEAPVPGQAVFRVRSKTMCVRVVLVDLDDEVVAQAQTKSGARDTRIQLAVGEGDAFLFRVKRVEGDSGAVLVSVAIDADLDEETKEVVRVARSELVKANRAKARGAWDEARRELSSAVESLDAIPVGLRPDEIEETLWRGATLAVDMRVLEVAEQAYSAILAQDQLTLPDDDRGLLLTRGNLGNVLSMLGRLKEAEVLMSQVAQSLAASVPPDDPDLMSARANLALLKMRMHDDDGAREIFRQELEMAHAAALSNKEAIAAYNLGCIELRAGRPRAALPLVERARALFDSTRSEDDPVRVTAAMAVAVARMRLGDLDRATALFYELHEQLASRLGKDDTLLATVRHHLADVLMAKGRYGEARRLQQAVCDVFSRTRGGSDRERLSANVLLAVLDAQLGELPRAEAVLQHAVTILNEAHVPEEDPLCLTALLNLAGVRKAKGDVEGALAIVERLLRAARTARNDVGLANLLRGRALLLARLGQDDQTKGALLDLAKETHRCLEGWFGKLAPRAIESLAVSAGQDVSLFLMLQIHLHAEDLDETGFVLAESARAAGAMNLRRTRRLLTSANAPEIRRLQTELARSSRMIREAVESGTGGFLEALQRKDETERSLARLARSSRDGPAADPSPQAIAACLDSRTAAVGYWRCGSGVGVGSGTGKEWGAPHYVAWVLRKDQPLRFVDLGSAVAIEEAVDRWRALVGRPVARNAQPIHSETTSHPLREAGETLRSLVLDPVCDGLEGKRRLVIVPDAALHLIPFDALPLSVAEEQEGAEFVGDRWEISLRVSLKELTIQRHAEPAAPSLLACGGIDYDPVPEEGGGSTEDSIVAVRGVTWDRSFTVLPQSKSEIDAVAAYFRKAFPAAPTPVLLDGPGASVDAWLEAAPRHRFLHLATHAWFAPESISSLADSSPILGVRFTVDRMSEVRGMAPMVLCGLAFAGANGEMNETGSLPGLLSAEELATCSLGGCELAVLSGCETNVGIVRAGQGIASLREALHVAGVRTAVTSLWTVPDAATRDLMADFYRRVWVLKRPKARSLWEAKRSLATKSDSSGRPRYSLWEWAGWVLSGDPD